MGTMGQRVEATVGTMGLGDRDGHRGVGVPPRYGAPWFLHLLSAPRRQATEEPPATAENLRPFNLVIPFTVQKGEITGMGWGGPWGGVGWGTHSTGQAVGQPPAVPG